MKLQPNSMNRHLKANLLVSTALIGLWLSGCSESRVSQCNKLVEVANEAAELGRSFGEIKPDPEKPEESIATFRSTASQFDTLITSMEAAEVSDEKLQGYQADFIKMYETVTQGLRDTADAIEKEDVPGIQAGVKMIQDGAAPESQLVDDINAYCSGGS